MLNMLHLTAGTACVGNSSMIISHFFSHIFLCRFLVIGGSFSFHKGNCTCRTGWKTISQTITIIISQKFGFSVYHADRALVTGYGTSAAAVTFFFVYLDNFPNHFHFILSLVFLDRVYYNQQRKSVVITTKREEI